MQQTGQPLAGTQAKRIAMDPMLARDVAQLLVMGVKPQAVALQLAHRADAQIVNAYVQKAMSDPFFQGAMNVGEAVKKRDWVMEVQRKAWASNTDALTVPRHHKLDPETFLKEYYANQRPVVISGLVDDWPALSRWDPDYIEDKVGRDTMVEVQKGRESRKDFELAKVKLRSEVPFGEVADKLRSGEPSNDLYITANNASSNINAFRPLWNDFADIPGYTKSVRGDEGFLWIGPSGTVTPFHHDLTNNLLIQVKGRKRIVMVPNWEEPRMRTRQRMFSDWSLEDMKAAPANVRPQMFELEWGPGDALFIPCGWWHHVVSLDVSCSVLFTNFVWNNNFNNHYLP